MQHGQDGRRNILKHWEKDITCCQAKEMQISLGDIVLIRGHDKHMGKLNMGMVEKLYRCKDGVIQALVLRTSKLYTERPIQ